MMNILYSPIIQAEELKTVYGKETFVLLDVSGGPQAKTSYLQKHLSGALFVDLNTQLADIKNDPAIGGRHPLPSIQDFSITLGNLGITKHSHVVLYDDKYGSNAAARFWWMLKAVCHERVQVLNGGIQQAEKAGFPMESGEENPKQAGPYPVVDWKLPIANIQDTEAFAKNPDNLVIDVRDKARYEGLTEPLDLIAGHIPGAINVPFSENLETNGLFKAPEILKKQYEAILEGRNTTKEVIVHCGSGVTACHTLLAMDYAGLHVPKLYVGSWSEWSRNNKPMVLKA